MYLQCRPVKENEPQIYKEMPGWMTSVKCFWRFSFIVFSYLVFFFSSCILDLGGWYNSNWWYIPIVTNLLKNQRFVTARILNFMNDFEKSKTKVHQWKSKSGLDLLKKVSHLTKDCLRKCHRKLCKHDISFSENE